MTTRSQLKFQELCRKQWVMKKRLSEVASLLEERPVLGRMMAVMLEPEPEVMVDPPPQKH